MKRIYKVVETYYVDVDDADLSDLEARLKDGDDLIEALIDLTHFDEKAPDDITVEDYTLELMGKTKDDK